MERQLCEEKARLEEVLHNEKVKWSEEKRRGGEPLVEEQTQREEEQVAVVADEEEKGQAQGDTELQGDEEGENLEIQCLREELLQSRTELLELRQTQEQVR